MAKTQKELVKKKYLRPRFPPKYGFLKNPVEKKLCKAGAYLMNPLKICSALKAFFEESEKGSLLGSIPVFNAFEYMPLDAERVIVSATVDAPLATNKLCAFDGNAFFRLILPVSAGRQSVNAIVDEFYSFFSEAFVPREVRDKLNAGGSTGVYFAHAFIENVSEPEIDETGFVYAVRLRIVGQVLPAISGATARAESTPTKQARL